MSPLAVQRRQVVPYGGGGGDDGNAPVGDRAGLSHASTVQGAPEKRTYACTARHAGHSDSSPHAGGHAYSTSAMAAASSEPRDQGGA